MSLGLTTAAEAAPIQVGQAAKSDPILASASVIASNVMLKMAASPRPKRLDAMTSMLNGLWPGMGTRARAIFVARAARLPPDLTDQAMFDSVRAVVADRLVDWATAKAARARGAGGLGASVADINAVFCGVIGVAGTAGGYVDAFHSGSSGAGGITASSAVGGTVAGCNVSGIDAQTRLAEAQGRVAQSTLAQQALMASQAEDRQFKYLLLGGGGLIALVISAVLLKK